jgi:uncharacterized membrane protein
MSKNRVEAFSDGVFAIAITLLVLTVAQPRNYRGLAHELGRQWPSLAAYVVSFAVIGIMWINHHSVFTSLKEADRGLLYLNLLLLMTIAFLPYPTGVLGQALARGQGTRTAAAVYGVVMTLNAFAWSGLWLYASRHRRLLRSDFPESERVMATLLFTFGVLVYTLSIGVAFLNAYAFLALQGALAVYYAFDPISRRAARQGQAVEEGQKTPEASASEPAG